MAVMYPLRWYHDGMTVCFIAASSGSSCKSICVVARSQRWVHV